MARLRRCLCIASLAAASGWLIAAAGAAGPQQTLLAASDPVELGAAPVRVALSGPASLPSGRQVYLVLHDLRATAQPGVVYDVYLGLPATGAAPGPADPRYVGTINFFAAGPPANAGRTVSYEVTRMLRRLQAEGALRSGISATIAPEGVPEAAGATIGRIELVAQ
ncbi:MAG: hypothetical protein JO264_06525 [Acidisphaera sp.]|nr:hypothetical protein [Acidisphaera sp.]